MLERAHARRRIGAAEHDHGAVGDEAAVERVGVAEEEDVGVGGARQVLGALVREHVEAVVASCRSRKPRTAGSASARTSAVTLSRGLTGAPPRGSARCPFARERDRVRLLQAAA